MYTSSNGTVRFNVTSLIVDFDLQPLILTPHFQPLPFESDLLFQINQRRKVNLRGVKGYLRRPVVNIRGLKVK